MNDKNNEWCNFEATEPIANSMEYAAFMITCFMWVLFYISVYHHKKMQTFRLPTIWRTYQFIQFWLIFNSAKTCFNVAVYENMIAGREEPKQNDPGIMLASSIFLFLDFSTLFWLNSMLFSIPFLWLKSMIQNVQSESLTNSQIVRLPHFSRIHKIYSLYMKGRILLQAMYAIILVVSLLSSYHSYFEAIIVSSSILQAGMLLFLYAVGIAFFATYDHIISKQFNKCTLYFQYGSLLLVNLLRIIVNSMTWFSSFYDLDSNRNCESKATGDQSWMNNVILAISLFLMHIYPVAIIMWIYYPHASQHTETHQSLLQSQVNQRKRKSRKSSKKGSSVYSEQSDEKRQQPT